MSEIHYNNEVRQSMLIRESGNMQEEVQDKYHLARILFYALGTLTQVSHTFFVNANDYWMYKFRDTNVPYNASDKDNRTELQTNFTSQFNIVSQVSSLVFLVATILLAKRISSKVRIFCSMILMMVIFVITLILIAVDTDSWQGTFYIVTFVTGSILSGSGTAYTITIFELVGKFPPAYLSSNLSGQAICGIVGALVQIFALGIGAASTGTAFIYFSIGTACIFGVLIYFSYISIYSEYFIYHMNKEVEESNVKITKADAKNVIGKVKYLLLSMVFVLGATIMINPGLTSLIVSVNPNHKWNDVFFVPVCTFLIYHTCDFIGREVAPLIEYPKNGLVVLILALVRAGLVPLILFCNLQPRKHTEPVFNSDTAYIIFMILFSLSNGYLLNLCVYRIPHKMANEAENKIGMVLIVLFIIASLALCSLFAEVLKHAI